MLLKPSSQQCAALWLDCLLQPCSCISLSSLGPAQTAGSMGPRRNRGVKVSVPTEGVRPEDAVGTGPAPGEITEWLWGVGVLRVCADLHGGTGFWWGGGLQ